MLNFEDMLRSGQVNAAPTLLAIGALLPSVKILIVFSRSVYSLIKVLGESLHFNLTPKEKSILGIVVSISIL